MDKSLLNTTWLFVLQRHIFAKVDCQLYLYRIKQVWQKHGSAHHLGVVNNIKTLQAIQEIWDGNEMTLYDL